MKSNTVLRFSFLSLGRGVDLVQRRVQTSKVSLSKPFHPFFQFLS